VKKTPAATFIVNNKMYNYTREISVDAALHFLSSDNYLQEEVIEQNVKSLF